MHEEQRNQDGLRAYIHEAVVEEETKDGSAHPLLRLHGRCHPRPHDGTKVGARRGVEVGRELRIGRAGENREDDGKAKQGRFGEDGHCYEIGEHTRTAQLLCE